MRGFKKQAFHDTAVGQKNAVRAEELADYRKGDRVMTVDGFPGRVTGVLFGPYQGTESYQVELDNGMGGGDYSPGQLAPISQMTASRVEAVEYMASLPVEAVTNHSANVDYPELEDILERRLPNENIKVFAAVNKDDEVDKPDSSKEDPGQNLEQEQEDSDSDPSDPDNPDADPEAVGLDGEQAKPQLGDVTPPSACSYCGGSSFGDTKSTGRGVRTRCDQCGGTMVSWGGQWQPEFPNSSQNNPSQQWDYRSGGPGGIGQAPGGQPFSDDSNDPSKNLDQDKEEGDDEDGKTIKIKVSKVAQTMTKIQLAESLQSKAGIVQYLFNRLYEKARAKELSNSTQWWQPPTQDLGTNIQGPAHYDLVTPRQVSLGSISEYDDPDWRWHFTSSWMDVQAKATRIRREGKVRLIAASNTFITGEVEGDHNVYETQLNYVPGTRKVADWACGCKWASYTWGRSPRYRRFEGRLCSHALATQYEANARAIFGRDVELDTVRPDWQTASTPIVVQYDKGQKDNLSRRSFRSSVLDTDGIYPNPDLLDLQHPPVLASIQNMIDNDVELPTVIETMASLGMSKDDAQEMLFEALLSAAVTEGYLGHPEGLESGSGIESEASKQHRHKKHVTHQEHGRTWGLGIGPWAWCGLCGGSGCGNCNGTGQVAQSDTTAVGDGGAVDAGGATAKTAASENDAFDYGHAMGYDYADRMHAYNNGFADAHPGDYVEERTHHANSWIDRRHRQHVINGFDHGASTFDNEEEAGLPHKGGSVKTADYSTADPLVGLDAGQMYRQKTPHSNSENPASTGWATSQDPGDWGKSLISNDFGITFDAALDPPNPFHPGQGELLQNFLEHEQRTHEHPHHLRHMLRDVAPVIAGDEIVNHMHHDDHEEGHDRPHSIIGSHHEAGGNKWTDTEYGGGSANEHRFVEPQHGTCQHCARPLFDWEKPHGECLDCVSAQTSESGGHTQLPEYRPTSYTHWNPEGYTERDLHTLSSQHEAGGRHYAPNENQVQFSYETGLKHGHEWASRSGAHADFQSAANQAALYHEYQNPGMQFHYLDGFTEGAKLRNSHYPKQRTVAATEPLTPASEDHVARMMDATLHDEPEGALPSTDGADETDIEPPAGNSSDIHGTRTFDDSEGNIPGVDRFNTLAAYSEMGALTEDQQIIAEFQRTAGGRALSKEAMKDFSFREQQELINEGKGARARNSNDLKIAGTHYELLGDDDDDETILWI